VARGADRVELPNSATLWLAVSGGPDSMALLHGAAGIATEREWSLRVAHLDHGLRDGATDDARFVAETAEALGIPATVEHADVRAIAAAEHRSLEDAGRAARYRLLNRLAGAGAWIATGHTADDSAETVLLNLARGSGLAGLRGIPPRRGRIVRPLLGERRLHLRRLLDEAGQAYRIDPSNADSAFRRNLVRHRLLPVLEELNPDAVGAIARYARLAADDDALLDALASDELARRRLPDGRIDWHRPPPVALGRRVLRLAIGRPAPNLERIEALLRAAAGARGGVTVELGGGRRASVRERHIRLG